MVTSNNKKKKKEISFNNYISNNINIWLTATSINIIICKIDFKLKTCSNNFWHKSYKSFL